MIHAFEYLTKRMAALVALVLLAVIFAQGAAQAHSPLMLVEDNKDGTITVTAAFSNGSLGSGKAIRLKSKATGKVLWESIANKDGELTCPKQEEAYTVFFDGGPGHTLEKPGPAFGKNEASPAPAAKKYDATTGATRKAGADSESPVHYPEWAIPLSVDFDRTVTDLIPAEPLSLANDLGLVRKTSMMQCFQRHSQASLGGMIALVEKKRKQGKDVDFSIAPVGLCFGVTTGYLSLEYAIKNLYGYEIPQMGDFEITAAGGMGGVWDAWDLYFGKKLDRNAAGKKSGKMFIAKRKSTGKEIRFNYTSEFAKQMKQLGMVKNSPEKYPEGELSKVKKALVTKLLKMRRAGDYSFFKTM